MQPLPGTCKTEFAHHARWDCSRVEGIWDLGFENWELGIFRKHHYFGVWLCNQKRLWVEWLLWSVAWASPNRNKMFMRHCSCNAHLHGAVSDVSFSLLLFIRYFSTASWVRLESDWRRVSDAKQVGVGVNIRRSPMATFNVDLLLCKYSMYCTGTKWSLLVECNVRQLPSAIDLWLWTGPHWIRLTSKSDKKSGHVSHGYVSHG